MNDQHQSPLNILMICLKNAFNISIAHNFDLNIWSWARAHERDKKLLEVTKMTIVFVSKKTIRYEKTQLWVNLLFFRPFS